MEHLKNRIKEWKKEGEGGVNRMWSLSDRVEKRMKEWNWKVDEYIVECWIEWLKDSISEEWNNEVMKSDWLKVNLKVDWKMELRWKVSRMKCVMKDENKKWVNGGSEWSEMWKCGMESEISDGMKC